MSSAPSNHSFRKPFRTSEDTADTPLSQHANPSLINQFLNTEKASEILWPLCGQDPNFTGSASKETVMPNLFSGSSFDESSAPTHKSIPMEFNYSPETWFLPSTPFAESATSPQEPHLSEKGTSSHEIVVSLRSELAHLKGTLWAAEAKIRDLTHCTDTRIALLEQRYQQDQIKQNRIRHSQDLQLERRLQHYIQKSVVEAMQQAIDRFIRVRRSVEPESATQPSTYRVPNRPEGKGIFR